jgi:PqqD family protein of HPr-rel-A system
LVLRPESTGAFLFDPDDGSLKYLNATAYLLCQTIQKGTSETQLVDTLAAQYPQASKTRIEEDIVRFLADLEENGLLQHGS